MSVKPDDVLKTFFHANGSYAESIDSEKLSRIESFIDTTLTDPVSCASSQRMIGTVMCFVVQLPESLNESERTELTRIYKYIAGWPSVDIYTDYLNGVSGQLVDCIRLYI